MLRPASVRHTVLLAAGFGSRLGSAERGVPKPLVSVAGRPLIAHALDHAKAAGCGEAIIVIGHEGQRIRAAVEAMSPGLRVRFVENPDFSAPNGRSLLVAEAELSGPFYLQMVDHVFAGTALTRLAQQPFGPGEAGRLLVDRTPGPEIDTADATKVRLSGATVTAIGKGIEPWDAIDTGCFLLTSAVFDALRRVSSSEPLTVSAGMRQLVADGALGTADVDGIDWIDVDTPSDLAIAEGLIDMPVGVTAPRP